MFLFVNFNIILFKSKIIFDIIFIKSISTKYNKKRGRGLRPLFINLSLVIHALHLTLQVVSHQHLRKQLPTLLQYQRHQVIERSLLHLKQDDILPHYTSCAFCNFTAVAIFEGSSVIITMSAASIAASDLNHPSQYQRLHGLILVYR